jgi:HD-GYP domain-containing protein (c-di-GMP phosphodiesterase class II)
LLFKSPKKYRSPGTHQIPAERIEKGSGRQLDPRSINLFILFGMRKNVLRCGRSQSFSLYPFTRRVINRLY